MKSTAKVWGATALALCLGWGVFLLLRPFNPAYYPENIALREVLSGCDEIKVWKFIGQFEVRKTQILVLQGADVKTFRQSVLIGNTLSTKTNLPNGGYEFECYQNKALKYSFYYFNGWIGSSALRKLRPYAGGYELSERSKAYFEDILRGH